MIKTLLVAAVALTLAGQVQAAPVDFSQVLKDMDGKPMTDCDAVSETPPYQCAKTVDLTLRRLSLSALDFMDQQKREAATDKMKRGLLAQDIARAKGPLDLTAEDIKLIKEQIAAMPTVKPSLVVSAFSILDPASVNK